MIRSALIFLAALVASPLRGESPLHAYTFPAGMPASTVYQVSVAGQPVKALHSGRGSILSFGMSGPVVIEVAMERVPKEVVVRPLSSGIRAELHGKGYRLSLPRPMNLSVEADGDLSQPLLVFANPVRQAPSKNDPKVKYFEAGRVHEAGEILLKDGETLYLEGGAVVRGVVRAIGACHVAVRGPGILDAGTRSRKTNMLVLRECRNALLEDFTLLDPIGWSIHLSASRQVTVRNTRVIGWRANSDGLDIEYSSHVTVDGCFWRTHDDCIAIKAIYPPGVKGVPFEEMINPEFLGGHQVEPVKGDRMGDIDIRNCVLWNDLSGQGFEIGFELRIDEVRGVRFRDSDIIHVLSGGAFTIHNGDQAEIRDFLVENVRVEDTDRFIDFHVGLSIYSADCPREFHRSTPKRKAPTNRPLHANNPWQWSVPDADRMAYHEAYRGLVDGVTFRNVSLLKPAKAESIMNGFSPAKGISNVRFENVRIAGKPVRTADDIGIRMNDHVRGVDFIVPQAGE